MLRDLKDCLKFLRPKNKHALFGEEEGMEVLQLESKIGFLNYLGAGQDSFQPGCHPSAVSQLKL